jgi:hypothetical protein
MSSPLWDNPKFNKLDRLQEKLFRETHKFKNTPRKAVSLNKKDGGNRDPLHFGHWMPDRSKKAKMKEYLKVKKQLKMEFGY